MSCGELGEIVVADVELHHARQIGKVVGQLLQRAAVQIDQLQTAAQTDFRRQRLDQIAAHVQLLERRELANRAAHARNVVVGDVELLQVRQLADLVAQRGELVAVEQQHAQRAHHLEQIERVQLIAAHAHLDERAKRRQVRKHGERVELEPEHLQTDLKVLVHLLGQQRQAKAGQMQLKAALLFRALQVGQRARLLVLGQLLEAGARRRRRRSLLGGAVGLGGALHTLGVALLARLLLLVADRRAHFLQHTADARDGARRTAHRAARLVLRAQARRRNALGRRRQLVVVSRRLRNRGELRCARLHRRRDARRQRRRLGDARRQWWRACRVGARHCRTRRRRRRPACAAGAAAVARRQRGGRRVGLGAERLQIGLEKLDHWRKLKHVGQLRDQIKILLQLLASLLNEVLAQIAETEALLLGEFRHHFLRIHRRDLFVQILELAVAAQNARLLARVDVEHLHEIRGERLLSRRRNWNRVVDAENVAVIRVPHLGADFGRRRGRARGRRRRRRCRRSSSRRCGHRIKACRQRRHRFSGARQFVAVRRSQRRQRSGSFRLAHSLGFGGRQR
jgi:hypothetical protein